MARGGPGEDDLRPKKAHHKASKHNTTDLHKRTINYDKDPHLLEKERQGRDKLLGQKANDVKKAIEEHDLDLLDVEEGKSTFVSIARVVLSAAACFVIATFIYINWKQLFK